MTKVSYLNKIILILSLILLNSCSNKKENVLKTKFEISFNNALENGTYFEINNISALVYLDDFYLLSDTKLGFSDNKFMFHLIKKDDTFDNFSFLKEKYLVKNSQKGIFKKIAIIHIKIDLNLYKKIRIGQFDPTNISKGNIWAKEIFLKNKTGAFYKNELNSLINKNVIEDDFTNSLNKSRFFKISNGFYISLLNNKIFIISENQQDLNNKMMLHLIKPDNTFLNLDFYFKHAEISELLSLKKYRVAKVLFHDISKYRKIRIGQSNLKGNIWAQEIAIKEVLNNGLLIYNNELK